MVYLLYDIVVWMTAIFLVPCYLVRGLLQGKVRRGIRERLGFFDRSRFLSFAGKQVFWIHAVSVGETRAALPLIKALRKQYPQAILLLSNVTETGHAIAKEIADIDETIFFPLDTSWVVKRVLRRINPSQVLIVETELWPNFIRYCHQAQIPIQLVNGRISDRSFPRYLRVKRFLSPVLHQLSGFCMQSPIDAGRIAQLGAPAQLITVSGNLKFDMESTLPPDMSEESLRQEFCLRADAPVLVAGSTHRGEEEMVADVFRQLQRQHPDLILILVPRHPERCKAVSEMLTEKHLPWRLRSQQSVDGGQQLNGGGVLLVDSMGEMLSFYAVAQIVFVGGSMVSVGGHNILEAALVKKPVLFGPHMHNFREIASLIERAQGVGMVADGAELYLLLNTLLPEVARCRNMGEKGWALLQQNVGASQKTLREIARCRLN
ncbi:MAG: 3-deoxy-D-manno-octulosonic acid transferase [Desulfuromonas sp.]|nr:3-deoxy-D-manno-octulosonic acid transferase [Desulfuromonas sp.]